jgi:hypothetical protein
MKTRPVPPQIYYITSDWIKVSKKELFWRQYLYICSVGYRSSKEGLGLWWIKVSKKELFWRQYLYICSVGYRSSKEGSGLWFYATLNNISAILWRSVLLVQETGVPGESHRPVVSHWQTLSHNVVSSTPRLSGVQIHNVSGDMH